MIVMGTTKHMNNENVHIINELNRIIDDNGLNNVSEVNINNNHRLILQSTLNIECKKYYVKNREKFIKHLGLKVEDTNLIENYNFENFEQDNEKSFKAIYKFSKGQANKLEQKYSEIERPKTKKKQTANLKKENDRLVKLLDKRHLKNKNFKTESESSESSDTDSEKEMIRRDDLTEEQIRQLKRSLSNKAYDHYSKIYNTQIDKCKFKNNIVQSMFRKALVNQDKSKIFKNLNIESLIETNSIVDDKFKVDLADFNLLLENNYDEIEDDSLRYNDFSICINSNDQESKTINNENSRLFFKNSPNLFQQTPQFRISRNKFNANYEIFRP